MANNQLSKEEVRRIRQQWAMLEKIKQMLSHSRWLIEQRNRQKNKKNKTPYQIHWIYDKDVLTEYNKNVRAQVVGYEGLPTLSKQSMEEIRSSE